MTISNAQHIEIHKTYLTNALNTGYQSSMHHIILPVTFLCFSLSIYELLKGILLVQPMWTLSNFLAGFMYVKSWVLSRMSCYYKYAWFLTTNFEFKFAYLFRWIQPRPTFYIFEVSKFSSSSSSFKNVVIALASHRVVLLESLIYLCLIKLSLNLIWSLNLRIKLVSFPISLSLVETNFRHKAHISLFKTTW